MKYIGAQLYTVREKLTSSDEIKATLAAIKNIGYDSVQLFGSIDLASSHAKAAKEEGLTNFIVEQDICEGDPIESLRQSYKFIKSLLEV